MSPLVLVRLGHQVSWASTERADVVGAGSLLQFLPPEYSGQVWGTGLLRPPAQKLPYADFLAVRGHLTRKVLDLPVGMPVGDPGLLIGRWYDRAAVPRYAVGVVPHFSHRASADVDRLAATVGPHSTVIDVRRDPQAVIRSIAKCEVIITSSLHGLVVADALGIPAAWFLGAADRELNAYKYLDHETVVKPEHAREVRISEVGSRSDLLDRVATAKASAVAQAQSDLVESSRRLETS